MGDGVRVAASVSEWDDTQVHSLTLVATFRTFPCDGVPVLAIESPSVRIVQEIAV
jgi:hypothetical protein